MNYLIMYLTSCMAVDKDSCCDIKPITTYHGIDKISVGCMAECAVSIGISDTTLNIDFDLRQTQCTADCLGKKKGYVTKAGTFLSDVFLDQAQENLKGLKRPKLVETCVDNYRNETELYDNDYMDVELKIFYCIFKEIQLKCPIIHQRQPRKCLELQKYLRNDRKPIPRTDCNDTDHVLRDLSVLLNSEESGSFEQ